MQTAKKILMVRPAHFSFNEETAKNNYFQKKINASNLNEKALAEFDNYVDILTSHHIDVVVVQDSAEPHTPDSIYPNNWFSTHSTGELVLYPMFAENRRQERKQGALETIKRHFNVHKIVNLSDWESKNRFLEGTGSLILDHCNRVAYACRSERTDDIVFEEFYTKMNFEPELFNAYDENGKLIYHTNVMLSIGEKYAVICAESIVDEKRRRSVIENLQKANKKVIEITYQQMRHFCANILEVRNTLDENCLIMSESAQKAFTPEQIALLSSYCKIVSAPLDIIEATGGGSARCMIAEIF